MMQQHKQCSNSEIDERCKMKEFCDEPSHPTALLLPPSGVCHGVEHTQLV
jgi:hypothetical protein